MTFTYDVPSVADDLSTVRFYTGDTLEEEHFLEDEEIQFLIEQWSHKGSMLYVAAAAADAIAAELAREISLTSDGQSLALDGLYERYKNLAVELRAQHEDALVGGTSLYAGGMDAYESPDPTVAPLSFGTGMHDNPEAGNQDYGGADAVKTAWARVKWGEEVP